MYTTVERNLHSSYYKRRHKEHKQGGISQAVDRVQAHRGPLLGRTLLHNKEHKQGRKLHSNIEGRRLICSTALSIKLEYFGDRYYRILAMIEICLTTIIN